MRHAIIASQPTHRKIIAEGLIDRGAKLPLLYLWFNLINANYRHIPISVVMENITDAIRMNPSFEDDITEWFRSYEQTLKDEKNNRTH